MKNLLSSGDRPRPLEGVRIVECGIWHAGPGGSAILADLGAEVIKVESLDGDPVRVHGRRLGTVMLNGFDKEDWSILYEISNRSKRGICVDLSSDEGRQILARLVQTADIFMTNYKRSTIPKLGVDYETLARINPRLIHIAVSGYGPSGPMADLGGFDPLGQAISGMVFITGSDEPVVLQAIILDQITAIAASHAMLTALYVRERRGYGQSLHVSLYGSAIWMMYANILNTSVMGKSFSLAWNRAVTPPMRNCYKCSDGKWVMGTSHPEYKYWPIYCDVIGLRSFATDPRFATQEARAANIRELIAAIDKVMLTRPSREWLDLFQARGLLFVPVQSFSEVISDPHARENGYIVDVDHPTMGRVAFPGYPVHFSANSTRLAPAPERGEHTADVLAEIGYAADEISRLKDRNLIK